MKFGAAIEEAKSGNLIFREGWGGKEMFVFMRPEDSLDIDFVIEKVKSVPDAFKKHLTGVRDKAIAAGEAPGKINFSAYLCMKTSDGSVVNGWLASQTDIQAEDWGLIIP